MTKYRHRITAVPVIFFCSIIDICCFFLYNKNIPDVNLRLPRIWAYSTLNGIPIAPFGCHAPASLSGKADVLAAVAHLAYARSQKGGAGHPGLNFDYECYKKYLQCDLRLRSGNQGKQYVIFCGCCCIFYVSVGYPHDDNSLQYAGVAGLKPWGFLFPWAVHNARGKRGTVEGCG